MRPRIALAASLVACACFAAPSGGAVAAIKPLAAGTPAVHSVVYDPAARTYVLVAQGAEHVVSYTVDLDDADLVRGMLRIRGSVDGAPPAVIVAGAGTRWRNAANAVLEPDAIAPTAGAQLGAHRIEGDTVVLPYTETPGAHSLAKTYRLRLEGLSLAIRFASSSTYGLDGYAGVSLGWAEDPGTGRVVSLPYVPEPIALLAGGSVLTAFVDPTVSSAVATSVTSGPGSSGRLYAHGRSRSEPDTAGVAAPLDETAYVTLSADLLDALPSTTAPASPRRGDLSSRVVLDVWGLHRSFPLQEGVAYVWTAPQAGLAQLTVWYADANPSCGNGVWIVIRHDGEEIHRAVVPNGEVALRSWSGEVPVEAGDTIAAEVDRAGDNNCDATALQMRVVAGRTYDTRADFSTVQGQAQLTYVEYVGGTATPMTWSPTAGAWVGAGTHSLIWLGGAHPGWSAGRSFAQARDLVRRYREYGLERLAILFHVWQRWGFDAGFPDHHPANPSLGGEGDFAGFVADARAAGMLVALHENYTDMYEASPLWDATAVALDAGGTQKQAWYNASTQQQSYRVAAHRMAGFAASEGSDIAASYAPNASFLDVSPGWSPGWAIDHRPAPGRLPTMAQAHAAMTDLFEQMRLRYSGPLLGEGGETTARYDTYFAGAVDGVERQTERRSHAWVVPDHELAVVKPRMLNHGLGYYSRYFADNGQRTPYLSEADLDQYRATEIAFGHAGFLGDSLAGVTSWLRIHGPEYWMMQALQSRYADAALTSVRYHDGAGVALDLESALRAELPLGRARVHIAYGSGLQVAVNRDASGGKAGVVADFSSEQGKGGWRYYEDAGAGLAALTWSPFDARWQGAQAYSFQTQDGGHPHGGAIVRKWTSSVSGTVRIRGELVDQDPSCGDGVRGVIHHGATPIWDCLLPENPNGCSSFDLTPNVAAGEELSFRVEPRGGNSCDSTAFPATITWSDGASHDWTVATPDGARVLPPSGFAAWDGTGFRAYTARAGGDVVDYVGAPEYRFARTRSGQLTAVEDLATDGAISIVPRVWGDDLHGLDLTRAERAGALLAQLSVRGDLNVLWTDSRTARIHVHDPAVGIRADLTWGAIPTAWRAILGVHPEDLVVRALDAGGSPTGTPLPVTFDPTGNPVIPGLRADVPYRAEIVSACLAASGCGAGEACCAGRCVAEPAQLRARRDGADVVLDWSGGCPAGDRVLRSPVPSDFGSAEHWGPTAPPFRDPGAAAVARSYFYLVR